MQLTSRFASVTDTNGCVRGELAIRVAFDGAGPMVVEHDDRVYIYTGKAGVLTCLQELQSVSLQRLLIQGCEYRWMAV